MEIIVSAGPMAGVRHEIPWGHVEVGRFYGIGIRLDAEGVSRRHAAIDRSGDRAVITDLGSLNGTYVNGRRLAGAQILRHGDRLRIGPFELQFSTGSAGAGMTVPSQGYGFQDVYGPVNAGDGQQYVAGRDQFVAGRDIHGDDRRVIVNADYDAIDEIFQGRGFGRFLAILGLLVALAGFALFAYTLFSGMDDAGPPPGTENPFVAKKLFGLPVVAVGFGAFVAGGVLSGIGVGISKAARRRVEEIEYLNRTRRPRRP
ncbi:FHA domain-containing protein [Actinacidiphila paucisporea]|uniref:FHA domain-containing protein n=1 Tax=Actinacidiphila paucisporea TaxID=310782 RepID=A0A1M7IDJ1_9ACTN|nr:FHA domain-containing protein [Actinacidiphila paucisporea]SHM38832.1 FHA domain-containing protein [Actinacidiphila paucisporea]